ncbi:hypothetical protein BG015_001522, partial [Linnemannia schmuckeri]
MTKSTFLAILTAVVLFLALSFSVVQAAPVSTYSIHDLVAAVKRDLTLLATSAPFDFVSAAINKGVSLDT